MINYEISAAAVTTATPERIFAVLDDFDRWPDWMPAFKQLKVELPPDSALGPGYRFHLRSGLVRTEMEVLDYGPLTRTTSFRVSFPPLSGTNSCRIVPLVDGRYRIERVDSLALPELLVNLIDATQRERFARLAGEFLQSLKRTVEAEA
jgi:hypothetical protein